MDKKKYTVTVEDKEVIEFVEYMATLYSNPKSRILLAGLYALMDAQGLKPPEKDYGLNIDITLGEMVALTTKMKNLESRMSELEQSPRDNDLTIKRTELRGLNIYHNEDWFEDMPPF